MTLISRLQIRFVLQYCNTKYQVAGYDRSETAANVKHVESAWVATISATSSYNKPGTSVAVAAINTTINTAINTINN